MQTPPKSEAGRWFDRARRVSLTQRFVLLGLVAMIGTGLVLGSILAKSVEHRALVAATDETLLLAETAIAPSLSMADLKGLTPQRAADLDRLVRRSILPNDVAQVKLWNRHGTVLYSSAPGVTGKTYAMAADLREALAGEVHGSVSNLDEPEHAALRHLGRAFEIYVPLRMGGRVVGAFEIYRPYAPLAAGIRAEQLRIYAALTIGLLLLFALLGRVVQRASRTLVKQAGELAGLYEKEHAMVTRMGELDELKTDIVAAVSHELSTPLTIIRGALETVLKNPRALRAPERTLLLESAYRGSGRLERLIDQLLAIPRIYSGDLRVRLEALDLEEIVAEAVGGHRGIVRVILPPDPPEIVSDREVVRKVLELLVANAVKFSPPGTPVTVRLRQHDGGVTIAVEDLGPGVPRGEEERIFEPFYQADHRASRSAGGVGLGLHLARTLAALVDGTIDVDPRRRQGSRFVLTLAATPPAARPSGDVIKALRASA